MRRNWSAWIVAVAIATCASACALAGGIDLPSSRGGGKSPEVSGNGAGTSTDGPALSASGGAVDGGAGGGGGAGGAAQ